MKHVAQLTYGDTERLAERDLQADELGVVGHAGDLQHIKVLKNCWVQHAIHLNGMSKKKDCDSDSDCDPDRN